MMGSMSMEMGEMMARMDGGVTLAKGGGDDDLGEVLSGKPPD